MFRLTYLSLLLSGAIVPIEGPAAHAEQWMKVRSTSLCVDTDSIRRGDDGEVTWLGRSCEDTNNSLEMKANCQHHPLNTQNGHAFDEVFYVFDGKAWQTLSAPENSEGWNMYYAV